MLDCDYEYLDYIEGQCLQRDEEYTMDDEYEDSPDTVAGWIQQDKIDIYKREK